MYRLGTHVICWAHSETFQLGDLLDGTFHSFGQLRFENDVALALAHQ